MVEQLANYLSLTIWDWMAFLVAMLSLIVALLSFIIAKRTLKSQKQTEINTLPVINIVIQEFLFKDLILRLFDGHLRATAIWNLLNEKSYKYYVSERYLHQIKIPNDNIHIELFYNSYDKYRTVQGLKDIINDYNNSIDVLNCHLKDSNIGEDVLYLELRNLITSNDRIAKLWAKIMKILWGYDKNYFSQIFMEYIIDMPNLQKDEIKLEYYKINEVYSDFFENERDSLKMLRYMDAQTKEYISLLSIGIIERK